jgi:serine/threonine-protein kinase
MLSDSRPLHEAPAAPAAPGEVIGGKYRVGECIGYGGMGVVCAATHLELERKLAIKFVRPELAESNEFVTRFLNEARAAAALRSEHVAQVLDCGRLPSGTPYMVLEHLEGADLESIVGSRGPLPVALAVDLALQLCEALAEAHAAHIIHRDIKPQNLFVTEGPGGTPTLKVLDFGVSKRLYGGDPSLTQGTQGVGSPHYMSPEQMTSPSDVDERTDIWSVGAVLFELLAGRPPFTGESLPEICAKVVTQPAPFIRSFRPNVPPRLESVVQRCLEKNRDQRFADMGELAEALAPFASPQGLASIDLVARILGRDINRRSAATVVVVEDELPPSPRRGRVAIPGVRRSRVPLVVLILILTGATVFGAQQLVRGGLHLNADPIEAADTGALPPAPLATGPLLPAHGAPVAIEGGSSPTVQPAKSDDVASNREVARRPAAEAEPAEQRSAGAADAGAPRKGRNPRELPKSPDDPRDIDPPGIGVTPILTDPPEMETPETQDQP